MSTTLLKNYWLNHMKKLKINNDFEGKKILMAIGI